MTLESLLARYKSRLRAATFRLLNENFDQPITTSQLHDYHLGYEEQMKRWPAVPVNILIKYITGQQEIENDSDEYESNNHKKRVKYHDKKTKRLNHRHLPLNINATTKIADIGCGTCKLSEGVIRHLQELETVEKTKNPERETCNGNEHQKYKRSHKNEGTLEKTDENVRLAPRRSEESKKLENTRKKSNKHKQTDPNRDMYGILNEHNGIKTSEATNNPCSHEDAMSCKSENVPTFYNYDLYPVNSSITKAPSNNIPIDDSFFDITVFCLSLMSKNVTSDILEAYRILKPNGHLLIAELTSRISTHLFITQLETYNFKLNRIVYQNEFFFIIDIIKIENGDNKQAIDIVLKPTVYKKR